jgi:hypothetical protein
LQSTARCLLLRTPNGRSLSTAPPLTNPRLTPCPVCVGHSLPFPKTLKTRLQPLGSHATHPETPSQPHWVLAHAECQVCSHTCWLLPTVAKGPISICEVTSQGPHQPRACGCATSRDEILLKLKGSLPKNVHDVSFKKRFKRLSCTVWLQVLLCGMSGE